MPGINPYPYPPPPGTMGPPIMNPGFGPTPPPMPMPYPNTNYMPPMPPMPPPSPYPYYDPRPPPYPRRRLRYRRPRRIRCRHGSRRCRPVIHIIDSDSCSSISDCSSISSCSPRRYRSCSKPAAVQQQPIILLPIQSGTSAPLQQQNLALPPMIAGGTQLFQAAPIQYVQGSRKSSTSSQSKLISEKPRSSTTPKRVHINITNTKKSKQKSLPEKESEFRRRFINLHTNDTKRHVHKSNIQIGR